MSYSFENSVTMIDDKTGKKITAKNGGTFFTAEDQRAKKIRKEAEAKRRQRRDLTNGYGGFVLMRKVPLNKNISPQTLGRLTYLAVYLTYEDDNRLMLTERQPMFRQDLPQVLGLPERTVDRFVKEAKNSGVLIVDKYGQLFMDEDRKSVV